MFHQNGKIMRKIISRSLWLLLVLIIGLSACKYDDNELWDKVNSLTERVSSIEQQLSRMNADISAISTTANALQNNVYVESVTNTANGYDIKFTDGKTVSIQNGENGKDAPVLTIDESEGKLYWKQIINGTETWITDKNGNKIPVTGSDAVAPLLKINASNEWMISTDGGINYAIMTDADGQPIKATGEKGSDGDSFFSNVRTDNGELILTLANGKELKVPLATVPIETLTAIVPISDPSVLGAWDEAYVTPDGFFCYSDELPASTPSPAALSMARGISSRATDESQKVLDFMSADGSSSACMLLSAEEKLPLQLISDDASLLFSYPNDSILELVYDDGSKMEMLDSIAYSRKELEDLVSSLEFTTQFQKALYYFTKLVDGHNKTYFTELIDLFKEVLKLKIDTTEIPADKLDLPKTEDNNYEFSEKMEQWFNDMIVTKVLYSVVMWTGNASFKVGGSSCTLSGTIWCASQSFNDYGTYGIVCDENPDNLTIEKAQYQGEGFQDKLELSYEVDFRGFKANTKYYYRAYYKFNSGDHGSLQFKYGDKDAQIGYDSVIKSFTTGDNKLNVDVVMCIDITGSMGGIINTVKNSALGFYDSFKAACDKSDIELLSLKTQVIGFGDKNVDGADWWKESSTYSLPDEKEQFSTFVNGLYADGGGDAPESGLEALNGAFSKTDWGNDDGYHRQVIILWTDAAYLVGSSYTDLTLDDIATKWNNMPSGRRLILFAPTYVYGSNGGNWTNLDSWKNVIHVDDLRSGFSDLDYILEQIIGELTGPAPSTTARSVNRIISRPNN